MRLLRGAVLKQSLGCGRLAPEEHLGRRHFLALSQVTQKATCANNAAAGRKRTTKNVFFFFFKSWSYKLETSTTNTETVMKQRNFMALISLQALAQQRMAQPAPG